MLLAAPTLADSPPLIPAYHDGEVVFFTVVSGNVVGVDHRGVRRAAIPLYAFGEPGNQPQFDVLAAVPREPDYNPWWEAILVVVLDDRDGSTNPFTSEEELLDAEADGRVAFVRTGFVFLCQVLPRPVPA